MKHYDKINELIVTHCLCCNKRLVSKVQYTIGVCCYCRKLGVHRSEVSLYYTKQLKKPKVKPRPPKEMFRDLKDCHGKILSVQGLLYQLWLRTMWVADCDRVEMLNYFDKKIVRKRKK